MAARGDNRGLHYGLAPYLGAAHQHGALHLGAGMHRNARLHVRVLENHRVIDMRRFLERTEDYRVADFRGALHAGMRANPAVAYDGRIAHHRALAHHAEGQRHVVAELRKHLVKGFLHVVFGLVEKLHVHEVRRDVREDLHLTSAHLVTYREGRANHVVNLAAAYQRANIINHGTATHQHLAQHGHLVQQGVFHHAVVHHAVVNTRRERHVAGQQESPVKGGQAYVAHKNRIVDAVTGEIRLHLHARPVPAAVPVLLERRNLVVAQGSELSGRGLRRLETLGQREQKAILQHFFQFQQSLHALKID